MAKIIGVVPASALTRQETGSGSDIYKLSNSCAKRVLEAGGIPMGVTPVDNWIPQEALKTFDGYLVQGQKRGEQKYRFYVTDNDGRICHELRIGLSHLHACAQTEAGHLLAAYRVEDQLGEIHFPYGLGCWTTDGHPVDYPSAAEFSACDFVAADGGNILVGTDDGNALLLRENGERIPLRMNRQSRDGAAFCTQTGKCISFDRPRREGEGILFHLAQPDAAPERVCFTDGENEIDVQYADAAGNTLLLADNARCYLYNL